MQFKNRYSEKAEESMIHFYNSLSEKDKRSYIVVEIEKLGYGGQSYICHLFHCDHHKIPRGIEELEGNSASNHSRIRIKGGGRKSILSQDPEIDEVFCEVMLNHTAGSPMNDEVIWTNLKVSDIIGFMKERGKDVSKDIVRQLLKKHGYKKRKAVKDEESKGVENRDEQFNIIHDLQSEYINSENPIISVDVKKKRK